MKIIERTQREEIIQDLAYRLLEQNKHQAVVDLIENEEYDNKNLTYEGQKIFTYLGFAYLQLDEIEMAEKTFLRSVNLKEDSFIESLNYIGSLNYTIKNNYNKAIFYAHDALKNHLKQKGYHEFLKYSTDEERLLKVYAGVLINRTLERKKGGHSQALHALVDYVSIYPYDKASYFDISKILEEAVKEQLFSNKIETAKNLIESCDYLKIKSDDIYASQNFLRNFKTFMFDYNRENFYFTLLKTNYLFANDSGYSESSPSLKNIFYELDQLKSQGNKETQDYIYIIDKYATKLMRVMRISIMKNNPNYFEIYYCDRLDYIENLFIEEYDYFLLNRHKCKYTRVEDVTDIIGDYFVYNEVQLNYWENIELKIKKYSVYYDREKSLKKVLLNDNDLFKLEEIIISHSLGEDLFEINEALDYFVENGEKFVFLKKLFIVINEGYEEADYYKLESVNYEKIWEALPNLEEISIKGPHIPILGEIIHNNIKKFTLQHCVASFILEEIEGAELPNLEELCIEFGIIEEKEKKIIKDHEIITEENLEFFIYSLNDHPKLKKLTLLKSPLENYIVKEVFKNEFVYKLETLNFSLGTLSDEGGKIILENIVYLPCLKHLVLIDHYISNDLEKILRQQCLDSGINLTIISVGVDRN